MTKNEAEVILSKKLQKQKSLFDGYAKGKLTLKCLCDNLSIRIFPTLEDEIKMLPPDNGSLDHFKANRWEELNEDEYEE